MNEWAWLLFAALAIAIIGAYLAGRVAGLGRGEQDRGDLAEKNNRLLGIVRQLEVRVAGQHQRIIAMTAWETVPWAGPDRRTSLTPVRPELEPLPAAELKIPRPRRERRTSTAAFLNPGPESKPELLPADVPVLYDRRRPRDAREDPDLIGKILHQPCLEEGLSPGDEMPGRADWWRQLEDEIWSARLWLATL